jgi:hypothetical protein
MPSRRFSRRGDTAVTERCAATFGRSVAPCPRRGKSWVLAMLAPQRGLRVAPVPPKTADLTRPARGRRDNGRSGRRNRRFDRTKEQPRTSWPCRHGYSSLTVRHPMVGETEHASHTEIRTLPPEEFHLRPLAEPCVRLSPHTAPIRRTRRSCLSANARRDSGSLLRWSQGRGLPASYDLQSVCTSAWPMPPTSG